MPAITAGLEMALSNIISMNTIINIENQKSLSLLNLRYVRCSSSFHAGIRPFDLPNVHKLIDNH